MGAANEIADNSTGHSTDSRAAPAVADNAANDCAGACPDCSPSLCCGARRQGNNYSDRSDKLSHGISLCFTSAFHQNDLASIECTRLSRVQVHAATLLISAE
jgi:hypothetical protein